MNKIFYVTKDSGKFKSQNLPCTDRFQQIDKLNELIALGWSIKEMNTDGNNTCFLLEKTQNELKE